MDKKNEGEIFSLQEVLEVVNSVVEELPVNLTKALRNSHKDAKKKDCKTLFYIHQCVGNKVFEKTVDAYMQR